MYKYPYGDSQQLNLDWILAKIKELENRTAGSANLEEISKALISLKYNGVNTYQRYDYCFREDKLYRCLSTTTGAFDPSAWQEALIGDDLAVLTRWINAIDAAAVVDVKFDTSGTNGKIQQKYNDQYHDVVEVDYTPVQYSKRPLSSNAGYELNGAITSVEKGLAIIVTGDTCTIAVPSGGYAYIKNNTHGLVDGLYRNKTASAFPTSGGTANSTIFEAVSSGIANQVTPVSLGGTGGTSPWAAKTNLQVGLRAGTFVAQTSGTTINVPSSRQFFCFADGGLFQFTAISNGDTNVKTMVAASQNITFNTSTLNKIIVTPASYEITMYWICFFDNAITT